MIIGKQTIKTAMSWQTNILFPQRMVKIPEEIFERTEIFFFGARKNTVHVQKNTSAFCTLLHSPLKNQTDYRYCILGTDYRYLLGYNKVPIIGVKLECKGNKVPIKPVRDGFTECDGFTDSVDLNSLPHFSFIFTQITVLQFSSCGWTSYT